MITKLTSLTNPHIKHIVQLSKSRERKLHNTIVVEGFREINMALVHGFQLKEFYYCPEIAKNPEIDELVSAKDCAVFEISKAIFEKVAYRENSDGLLALFSPKYIQLSDIKLSNNPLILVAESVEKPGNLGALLRTADAARVDAIVVCDAKTDIYNPNVIRSSLGCVFSQQVVACSNAEAMDFFKKNGIKTFAAALPAMKFYHETNLNVPAAIVMGTEADGLTDVWLNGADEQIKIPMGGKVDSLNVSTSAAILVFEALRQRGFRY
jgi:RNA methyltransferase, TrmH family